MSHDTAAGRASASVLVRIDGDVAHLVLNRPDRLNAIDPPMFDALMAGLDEVRDSPARALLLSAAGRAFCAGRDVSDADPEHEDAAALLRDTFNVAVRSLATLPVPTIAAVQGACMGAGFGLALACDVTVAAASATFGSPFGRLGAVPDTGFHWFCSTRLGPARTRDLVLTGRALSGTEAAALGLVARSVPDDELSAEADALARQIAAGPTAAFALSRSILDDIGRGASLDESLEAEATAQGKAFATDDLREGLAAMRERRLPRFVGR